MEELRSTRQDYLLYLSAVAFGNVAPNLNVQQAAVQQLVHSIKDKATSFTPQLSAFLTDISLKNLPNENEYTRRAAANVLSSLLLRGFFLFYSL